MQFDVLRKKIWDLDLQKQKVEHGSSISIRTIPLSTEMRTVRLL